MAKQVIGVGTTADDGTGDTLRAAFVKVNANTDELYEDDRIAPQFPATNGGAGLAYAWPRFYWGGDAATLYMGDVQVTV